VLDFDSPTTVTSVPANRLGKRSQRFQLHPGLSVTVHEDGRVRVRSTAQRLAVHWLATSFAVTEVDLSPVAELGDLTRPE
jgi:hypothetical protein